MWYAVQETREDAWDYGSDNYDTAVQMLKEQGGGLIAVIDNNVCVEELEYDDVCGPDEALIDWFNNDKDKGAL